MSRLEVLGMPASPYSRKLLAALRYQRTPYQVFWGQGQVPAGYPKARPSLLPTVFLTDAAENRTAATDTTPLLKMLDSSSPDRSLYPENPALEFLCDLIEDYADEWLTKAMFHYRWAHEPDIANAKMILAYSMGPRMGAKAAEGLADEFATRQIERLYVVGSNPETAAIIEESYVRLLSCLDGLFEAQGFVLGARPSAADFALFGQLTQLAVLDPTPAQLTQTQTPRIRAWVDLVEDLSGLAPSDGDWLHPDAAKKTLEPLLQEVGRTYAPVMVANGLALISGKDTFEVELESARWAQPAFKYQGKCLQVLRSTYGELAASARESVDAIIEGTGCEQLFGDS